MTEITQEIDWNQLERAMPEIPVDDPNLRIVLNSYTENIKILFDKFDELQKLVESIQAGDINFTKDIRLQYKNNILSEVNNQINALQSELSELQEDIDAIS